MSTLVKCCARGQSVWGSDQSLTFIRNGTRVEDSCAMVMYSAKRSCSTSVQVIRCRRHVFSTPTRTCVFFVMNKFLSSFRHFLLRVQTSEKLVNVGAETKCSSGEVSGTLSGKD